MSVKIMKNNIKLNNPKTKLESHVIYLRDAISLIDAYMSKNHIDYKHFKAVQSRLRLDLVFYNQLLGIDKNIDPDSFGYDDYEEAWLLKVYDSSDERGWYETKVYYNPKDNVTYKIEIDQDGGEELYTEGEGLVL